MKDAFSGFHPMVNFMYFAAVIGFSMFFMHPVCLGISLICASAYAIYLHGRKAIKIGMLFMLPMLIITAAMNPLFNHRGATILTYLPNGNPLTLESTLFGIAAAVMLITVIIWFSCFNAVITGDKFIYLFGRLSPALSSILSMSLRFVPRFRAQMKVIINAQKSINPRARLGVRQGVMLGMKQGIRQGVNILSITITWALENGIETADSMKNRGYGLPGRTAFSIFTFTRRDAYACVYLTLCVAVVIFGALTGAYHFRYFPTVRGQISGIGTITVFAAYLALAAFPIIINIKEELYWKRIVSKI